MPRALTDEEAAKLAHRLNGTCESVISALEGLSIPEDEIDLNEVESRVLDFGVEMCQGCNWWCEVSELAPDGGDRGEGFCTQCKEERHGDVED